MTDKSTNPKIFSAIPKIMADVTAVGKGKQNQQQGYKFRGIDDVYNALHTALAKHGVFTVPEVLEQNREERQTKSGGLLIYNVMKIRYTFYADDGSSFTTTVIGEAMDSGDKSSNKAMAAAHKYAFLQVFAIPTEDPKDSEVDTYQVAPKAPAKPAAPTPTPAKGATPKQTPPADNPNGLSGQCPECHAPADKPHTSACAIGKAEQTKLLNTAEPVEQKIGD
jgi:hypothetical protein